MGRGGKLYIPAEKGDGVGFEDVKIKPDAMRRIEALGKMNDRRMEYVAAGDGESLLRLADEYDLKKMPVMAERVRREAYESGAKKPRRKRRVAGAAAGSVHSGAA